jgi:iron-sulfur cluster repair protein YtfE (RIC family)
MARLELTFSEALRQAHVALRENLEQLEEVTQPGSDAAIDEVRDRLEATRAAITEHFRFEEQGGYMDVVRKREPRLDRTIDQLAAEHSELAQSLDSLIEIARVASTLTDTFRAEVRTWSQRVHQHEHRENEVVQDTFALDIAAED